MFSRAESPAFLIFQEKIKEDRYMIKIIANSD